MIVIHRNGLSGLALKLATIAFAAIMFGCVPETLASKAMAGPAYAEPAP